VAVSRLWDPPDVLAALRRGGEREARSAAAPASLPVAADAQSPSAL
jgi:hypothetical protein